MTVYLLDVKQKLSFITESSYINNIVGKTGGLNQNKYTFIDHMVCIKKLSFLGHQWSSTNLKNILLNVHHIRV